MYVAFSKTKLSWAVNFRMVDIEINAFSYFYSTTKHEITWSSLFANLQTNLVFRLISGDWRCPLWLLKNRFLFLPHFWFHINLTNDWTNVSFRLLCIQFNQSESRIGSREISNFARHLRLIFRNERKSLILKKLGFWFFCTMIQKKSG